MIAPHLPSVLSDATEFILTETLSAYEFRNAMAHKQTNHQRHVALQQTKNAIAPELEILGGSQLRWLGQDSMDSGPGMRS